MLYSPDNWQLMLVDHKDSFSTKKELPAYLRNIRLIIGDQWREALLAIDDGKLRKNLGDVLDKKRLAAIASRRDALIKYSNH